jgi:HK97 family phage prohead protease
VGASAKKFYGRVGSFCGYASVFNVRDRQGDVALPGAFRNSLRTKKPEEIKLLWQHRGDRPAGRLLDICEDQIGLFVSGILENYDVYCLVKNGASAGLSIGYRIKNCRINKKLERILTEIDLIEISVVNIPANRHSKITYCK